jgi:diadenosine tetraphosphate (Ap4A) HIT family hydrolase
MRTCRFCSLVDTVNLADRFGTVVVVPDSFPVTPGHRLVVPVRHCDDYFAMTDVERADAARALIESRMRLLAEDPSVTGFNIGWNCGTSAGQTVEHAHGHLIPRRDNDTPEPAGGVRGVIPERQKY